VSVLDEISRLLDVTASSLWLVDPSDGTLVCQEASGPRSGVVRGWRLDAGEGIVGWVARRGRSLIVPDTRQEPRHFKGVDSQTGLDLRSIVTVPLRTKKGVIGVLQVVDESVDRFGPTDLMLLESLAATAAIAIENARLYAQSQRDMQAKSTLLHEVNHRVKNNLSAIIGVLYAEQQRDPAADETAYRSVMQDLINRVQGLATVHRLLSSTDWAPVRLSDLTARVIHSCLETTRETKPVSVEVEPSEVRVTPDQAHQIALIVNELATNTLKHGLTRDGPARIAVAIGVQGQTAHLEYRDNGPGYPAEVLRFERTSVGFDLIRSVAIEGLRGELSLRNEGGAVTSIRFKSLVNGELDTGDRTYASLTSATSAS
jgi:two-component sensor histidine kinase